MIGTPKRSRRALRRIWGLDALEDRRLMTAAPVPQYAPGWGDAVDVSMDPVALYVEESAGSVPITITRGGDLTLGASVRVRTSAVDAVEGYDYKRIDQNVVFAPGSATAAFLLTILDDDISEPETKALYVQVYQTSDVISTETVASRMILIQDDEAGSRSPLSFHAFGDAGLWTYNDVEGYRKINDASPEAVYPASNRGAYLDFGSAGLWYWDALRGYEKLNDVNPQAILTSTDGNSLLIDFGAGGLWSWSRSGGYSHVTDVDPKSMVGSAESGLVDFGRAGLWSFTSTSWTKLGDQSPEAIVASNGSFYVDYGSRGLWWVQSTRLTPSAPSEGEAQDQGEVYFVLQQINPADPGAIAATGDGLFVSFGAAGLWKYTGDWTKVNDTSPRAMWGTSESLYLNYGTAGLWQWTGGVWKKLNSVAPTSMTEVSTDVPTSPADVEFDLAFDGGGLWRWSTTKGWKKLSGGRLTATATASSATGAHYAIVV